MQKGHVAGEGVRAPASISGSGTAILKGSRSRSGRLRPPAGLPWILPAVVVSVGLIYYCIIFTVYISGFNWSGVGPLQQFVGVANYAHLVHDPIFVAALWHTVIFYIVTFAAEVVLGLVFGALLHSKLHLRTLYKVLIFVPAVLATATTAPVFRVIFAQDGTLNAVLHTLGLGSLEQPWLSSGPFPLLIVIGMQIWQSTGVVFVLFFAAMGQVEPEVIEAARIDGARDMRILRSIIWPSVRGTTIAVAILSAIAALKTFDIPYLVTGGGPGYSTEFLGTRIYEVSVEYSQVGYGAAMSIVLLVLALVTALTINIGSRRGGRARV